MSDNIETRIHKIKEILKTQGDEYTFPQVPIYCIRNEIINAIEKGEFDSAYKSILNAGFGNNLPWPEILLEFDSSFAVEDVVIPQNTSIPLAVSEKVICKAICHLKSVTFQKEELGSILQGTGPFPSIVISSIYTMVIPACCSTSNVQKELTVVPQDPIILTVEQKSDGSGAHIQIQGKQRLSTKRYDSEISRMLTEQDQAIARRAHYLALTILNTSGIERTVIEPTRLNKIRQKQGKPIIPKHHVIRIAHVYDRSGNKHKYVQGQTKIHMRAGHTRQQAYGPKFSLHRPIWISPVLVNYKPETVKPKDVKL